MRSAGRHDTQSKVSPADVDNPEPIFHVNIVDLYLN